MKTNLIKYVCGVFLLDVLTTATAQGTVNYYITPVGGANSLVTWNITGSLTALPGVAYEGSGVDFEGVPINTSGLFIPGYNVAPNPQSIPTPDGSYYRNPALGENYPINFYLAGISGGNDIFCLVAFTPTVNGQHLTYNEAGTQSVIIPTPYSDFIPGTYQSIWAAGTFFDTSLTVNLTVGAVPEPSTLALSALGGLSALLFFHRRNKS